MANVFKALARQLLGQEANLPEGWSVRWIFHGAIEVKFRDRVIEVYTEPTARGHDKDIKPSELVEWQTPAGKQPVTPEEREEIVSVARQYLEFYGFRILLVD